MVAGVPQPGGSELVLTPAQRTLVEKSRAVRQQRAAALEAQLELEARNRAYVQEIKAQCQVPQHASASSSRRLILRHVGEELARVAHRERLVPSKARSAPQHSSNNRKASGPPAASNSKVQDKPSQQKPQTADNDGYDEERFGPVRRPPRKQPPNLWVPIFEQEVAEVQQAKEEAERNRVAAAVEYREQLARQEADKQRRRLDEKATADTYARAQAAQQAAWREQEKAKQKKRHDQVALEAQRWQYDLQAQAEVVRETQATKERNERRALERFRLLDEEEKRRKAERKAADMEEVVRVKQANAQQLELKRQAVLREQQEDLALQKAYEKKLEMQEAARRAELDAILAKQSQKVKLALLNVKSAEEKAREDEQRALAVQAAVRAREAELMEQKERKKREGARVQVQALTMQKEEKRSRRLSLEQEEAAYASKFKAEFQTWQKEQVAVNEKVNHRNREYQQLVRRQMAEDARRRADEDKYGMTLLEAELNTKLLQKAGIASPPEDIHRR
ncbi:putative pentafunctional AROM polypeptide [Phytophthora cinnamomi]|uniref:putative pentafunctional AROM polypeptide n=1 Tax=Phytophthora cinnamomi TaxID=4785 RepID=UPI00355A54F9|nr:putative pentafunctional AROM polypeptide [Phytophthora cinnamomi]